MFKVDKTFSFYHLFTTIFEFYLFGFNKIIIFPPPYSLLGGLPDSVYFPRRRYTNGIVGCISEIVISGEFKMNFDPNTLGTAHNVETGIL